LLNSNTIIHFFPNSTVNTINSLYLTGKKNKFIHSYKQLDINRITSHFSDFNSQISFHLRSNLQHIPDPENFQNKILFFSKKLHFAMFISSEKAEVAFLKNVSMELLGHCTRPFQRESAASGTLYTKTVH
jgi:hypothetical protein